MHGNNEHQVRIVLICREREREKWDWGEVYTGLQMNL